ncbi:MAG: choice-of-anchor Q domain-containing protein [Nitrospirales bacterium]
MVICVIGLTVEVGAHAATLTVTTAEDIVDTADGVLSLREAIAEAVDGDTIIFDESLFATASSVNPFVQGHHFINKDLTVKGPGASQLMLRSFEIDHNTVVIFSGVTINCKSSSFNSYCQDVENFGTMTLENTILSGKDDPGQEVTGTHAGIRNSGDMTLINTVVRDHFMLFDESRAGINNSGRMRLIKSTVNNNSNRFGSGGIFNRGTMTLIDSTVNDNAGRDARHPYCSRGGGISNAGTMSVTNSTVSANHGLGTAGISNSGLLTLTNSTVSGNTATWFPDCGGTGISNSSEGRIALINSTISDNVLTDINHGIFGVDKGGGIVNENGGIITLLHSIVAGNTATEGPDCSGIIISLGYNLVGAGTGCPDDGLGDLTVLPDDVFTDILGPLQNNGGSTDTHALLNNDDNHAINSGNPAGCVDQEGEALTTDQRGFPRPSEGGEMAICDIGAVELQLLIPGDMDKNGCVDQTDLRIILTALRGTAPQEISHDLNGDGDVNIADARKLVTLFTNSRGTPCS